MDLGMAPPVMKSFKEFLLSLDDAVDETEAVKRYNDYKLDFRRQQMQDFFLAHKDEEWYVAGGGGQPPPKKKKQFVPPRPFPRCARLRFPLSTPLRGGKNGTLGGGLPVCGPPPEIWGSRGGVAGGAERPHGVPSARI